MDQLMDLNGSLFMGNIYDVIKKALPRFLGLMGGKLFLDLSTLLVRKVHSLSGRMMTMKLSGLTRNLCGKQANMPKTTETTSHSGLRYV